MRKFIYLLIVFVITSLVSCSQDEAIDNQQNNKTGKIISGFEETFVTTAEIGIPSLVLEYANEEYNFVNPNSERWIEDSNTLTKSGSGLQTVTGYTFRNPLTSKNYKTIFKDGYPDPRVTNRSTVYIAEYIRYRHLIEIPKGYSLVLPPANVMAATKNMGAPANATKNQIGYNAEYIGEKNGRDQYYLVTDVVEVVYDLQGRQCFSPPVYIPYNVTNPKTMVFKYQYEEYSWD